MARRIDSFITPPLREISSLPFFLGEDYYKNIDDCLIDFSSIVANLEELEEYLKKMQ